MQRIEDTVADVLEAMRKRGIGDYSIKCILCFCEACVQSIYCKSAASTYMKILPIPYGRKCLIAFRTIGHTKIEEFPKKYADGIKYLTIPEMKLVLAQPDSSKKIGLCDRFLCTCFTAAAAEFKKFSI